MSMSAAVPFTMAVTEPTQVPNNRITEEGNVVCIHNGGSTIKNDTFLSSAGQWMQLEITLLSEESISSVICCSKFLSGHINLCMYI